MKLRSTVCFIVGCFLVGCFATCTHADLPVVMWVSYPVGAGDHVLVHGGAWGKDVRVVTDGGKTCPATVLSDTG